MASLDRPRHGSLWKIRISKWACTFIIWICRFLDSPPDMRPDADSSPLHIFSDFNGLRGFGEERFPQQQQHRSSSGRPVHNDRPDKRDYKLICDPALRHGPQKVYRYDGESATVNIALLPKARQTEDNKQNMMPTRQVLWSRLVLVSVRTCWNRFYRFCTIRFSGKRNYSCRSTIQVQTILDQTGTHIFAASEVQGVVQNLWFSLNCGNLFSHGLSSSLVHLSVRKGLLLSFLLGSLISP